MHFYCQMVGYDDPDEWTAVTNYSARSAAQEYAEKCDANSGNELLRDPHDRQTVLVKEKGSEEVRHFELCVEYSKSYHAHEQDAPDSSNLKPTEG